MDAVSPAPAGPARAAEGMPEAPQEPGAAVAAVGGRAAKAPLRLDIQGLRALAVTMVVLSHAGVPHVQGGYIGVDVFFVISGFLITSLLLRELSADGRLSIRKFYARRALRLLPASTIVVVATLGGAWLYLSRVRFSEYVGDALSSTFYVVNLRLAGAGTNYLNADSPPSPFQHFWSLAVEEQFYLIWPLLLLVTWKVTGSLAGASARRRAVLLTVPLVALCAVSFVFNVTLTGTSVSWAYFGSHARFWELGVGALLGMSVSRLERLPRPVAAAMTWTGLGTLVGAALWLDNGTAFPGYWALLPVAGAGLVLAGGCAPVRYGAGLVLSPRPVTWVGGVSYGWYLWHWPLLVILPEAFHHRPTVWFNLACCAVGLALAWLTLRLVENPVRFNGVFRGRPWRALALGAGLSAFATAAALIAAAFPPQIGVGAAAPALRGAVMEAADPQVTLSRLLAAPNDSLPVNMSPKITDVKGELSALYREGCQVAYTSTAQPPCVFGDPHGGRTVVLFGDSHAAQWFPALDPLARQRHWKLVVMTKSSCKVARITTVHETKPYASCDQWRAKAVERIVAMRPALVFAASSDVAQLAHPAKDQQAQWTDGFTRTFQALRPSGARVLAVLDTPWPKNDAVDCAAAHPLDLAVCTSRVAEAIQSPARRTEIRTAAARTGATLLDPEPWLCSPAGICPVVVGDTFVYRDSSHLSTAYAKLLAPLLSQRLTELFGPDLTGHPVS
ncbi:acyltransferase family protein [Streptomyces polygonati]|uniref:Acyltransferase family protein n=1 Tax=Streptomyces polygonati TaxID=1617087 RepID=A0ABV8HUR7_9ACTN